MIYTCKSEIEIRKILESQLQPGDIVNILPGMYVFDAPIIINSSGTIEHQISICGVENDVELNFYKEPYYIKHDEIYDNEDTPKYELIGNGITLNGSFVKLSNLIISNASFVGLQINGDSNIIKRVYTKYNLDSGIKIFGSNNLLKRCISEYNCDYRFYKYIDGKLTYAPGFNSDGISDKLHYGFGNTYDRCISRFNGDDGFDFFFRNTPSKTDGTRLRLCGAYYNHWNYVDLSGSLRLRNESDKIKDSLHLLTCKPLYGTGVGFKLGGKRSMNDENFHFVSLESCVATDNIYGFSYNHNNASIKLKNCIAKNNKKNYNFNYAEESCISVEFEHCDSIYLGFGEDNLDFTNTKYSYINMKTEKIDK